MPKYGATVLPNLLLILYLVLFYFKFLSFILKREICSHGNQNKTDTEHRWWAMMLDPMWSVKKKSRVGPFGTAACRPIAPLPLALIHLQRRHTPHRHARPLLAKEGTIQGILLPHS